jgi:CubicO group peptidase (beta-lactamase class C family)
MLATLALLCVALSAPLQSDRTAVVAGDDGARLDAYLTTLERFGFSGAVVVERGGELLLRKGYGVARPDDGTPNTPETLFDVASVSKQVTAAAVLKLAADGRLALDDPIADHLPGVPDEHADVTVIHLLTHTSGFPRSGPAGRGAELAPAVAQYLSGARVAEPGERFEYWNGGYALLAGVVESVTGETFEAWVRTNLFEPAGLAATDFIETARVDRARIAATHDGRRQLATEYLRGWSYRGMGGVLTSVSDLAAWCRALFGGEVLPAGELETMLTPRLGDYACGWYVFETESGRRVVQHGGTAPGFQSYVRWFPDEEALFVVACNREGMHWQVAWGLAALLLGEDPKAAQPPETAAWPSGELAALAGTWEASDGGTLVIAAEDGSLRVGALGAEAIALLTERPPIGRPDRSAAPSPKDVAWAEERALGIVGELADGRCDLLGAELLPHIPESWPKTVLTRLWPAEEERWGELRGTRSLGAWFDAASGRTRVFLRLERERGERSLEVAFVGRALNIFDLQASPAPVELAFVPVAEDRLVAFDFRAEPPAALRVKGGGKELELTARSGGRATFRRVQER